MYRYYLACRWTLTYYNYNSSITKTVLQNYYIYIHVGDGPFPGVIDMFGGVGGIIEFRAALLASRGFAALALAYFDYEDLPKVKDDSLNLELEYFEVIFVLIYYFDKFLLKYCVSCCCISVCSNDSKLTILPSKMA